MATVRIPSGSPGETRTHAEALAAHLTVGSFLALEGGLGAGKTTFVQGLGRGLGVAEPVASPTFVLLRVYRGRLMVYHFDAYRLEGSAELADLGAEDYFWGDGVTVLEWADRVADALPPDRLRIELVPVAEEGRELRITATGPRHEALLRAFVEARGGA